MTGKAKAVKGNSQGLDYLLNDKGTALELLRNGLIGKNGTEMFREFKMMTPNNPTKNLALSIVVSPHKIYTKDFTESDWQQLCKEVLEKLKLQDHQYLCALHQSRTTKHAHLYVNRISSSGATFSDKYLAFTLHKILDTICKERGWHNAKEINKHINKVEKQQSLKAIQEELKNPMNTSIDKLKEALVKRGYELHLTKNSSGYVGGRIIPTDYMKETTSKLEDITKKGGLKFSELDKDLRIETILNTLEQNKINLFLDKSNDQLTLSIDNKMDLTEGKSLNLNIGDVFNVLGSFGAGANDQAEENQKMKRKKKSYYKR
ncbi:hypothetical protein CHU00_17690 [Sphingobacterium cellulitidis]|uniref:relaxase/mobilization nuclease domain-containing protein n=1 Tax=Sphingobacterium cellulitidis TaxID=1768011 RepID=UPI000B93BC8E|nr:relaxase/mobilization nuclease domain-containing protein [Sphingobacterium cellulitidis]OYD44274.1 hypothetical protein CHU00_17690 [Sphingobacterium cellulitidis]